MLKSVTYGCPECGGRFSCIIDPKTDPPPRWCALCGHDTQDSGEVMEPGLATPHIGKSIRATVDNLHREMEAGAEFRANIAEATLGMDAEGAASMKMTNMRDGLREGDTADAPLSNAVTQVMQAAPPGMFGFQGDAGLGYSGAVAEGPSPNAGAHAQAALRNHHA